ncbi:MAG: oligosaccharide flippase family protein [Candidatus Pacebacteria bacterium]|nr:oligosaccharide flippase family protein [Candidatus Paceibacterota bacterium]
MRQETLRFAKNSCETFLARVLTILFGFIFSILVVREFGSSGQGVIAFLSTIVVLVVNFSNLGFPSANVYFTSKKNNFLPSIITNSLYISFVGGILFSAFGIIFLKYFAEESLGKVNPLLVYVFLLTVPLNLVISLFSSILLGSKKYRIFNIFAIIGSFLNLLAIIVASFSKKSLEDFLIMLVLVSVLNSIMYIKYYWRFVKLSRVFNSGLFNKMIRYGSKSYVASFLGFMIIRSDIFFVNYYLGTSEVGVYSIDVKFVDLIYLLPAIIGTILFSEVASQSNEKKELTKKVFRLTFYFLITLCFFVGLIFEPMILFLYGEEFIKAITPFFYLIPGIIALGLSTILMQDLAGRGLPAIVYIAPAVSLVVNVVLNIILIPKMGISGAAISSSVSYILMMMLMMYYFVSILKIRLSDLIIIKKSDIGFFINLFKRNG